MKNFLSLWAKRCEDGRKVEDMNVTGFADTKRGQQERNASSL
jgi:hypothetical protein